jgi:hypothetical protein
MIRGKIEIACDCGGDMEAYIDDHVEPWNEQLIKVAVCERCGKTVSFWIDADEPQAGEPERDSVTVVDAHEITEG